MFSRTGDLPIATWVLQDFTRKEMESMEVTIQETCDLVRKAMSEGLDKALSNVKGAEPPAKQPKQPKPAAAPAAAGAAAPQPAAATTSPASTTPSATQTSPVKAEPVVMTVAAGR